MSDDIADQNEEVRSGKGSRRESGGARVEYRDPRVSRAISWALGIFGSALVGVGLWIGTSINELNLTMARVVVRLDQKDSRDDRQDQHQENTDKMVSDLRGDMRELQGKTFRGVDGYKEPKGRTNGR